ncbi:MAG: response regulator transcription factor [Burkholderiaceae bacterium]|nr:response regulator transcription factor [Burkholderiaceae bacterium]
MPRNYRQQHGLIPPTSLLIKEAPLRPYRRLTPDQPEPTQSITPRQQEVLFCLVEGKPTKKICDELGMSEGTAKVHISAIFRALRVRNRTQATLAALRDGWIQPEMWSRS